MVARREKDAVQEKKRLDKEWRRVYGLPPPKVPTKENPASVEAAARALQNHEVFWEDSHGAQ